MLNALDHSIVLMLVRWKMRRQKEQQLLARYIEASRNIALNCSGNIRI